METVALDVSGHPIDGRELDDRGRVRIPHLTEREIAEETLAILRNVGDVINAASQNPMLGAMLGPIGNMASR